MFTEKVNQKSVQDHIQKLVSEVTKSVEDIQVVRPPQPELAESFKKEMDEIAGYRGRPLYWPYISTGLGRGPYVLNKDGSIKLDLINGIGVHVLGHSHPKVIAGTIEGSLKDVVNQGHLQIGDEYFSFLKN